MHLYIYIKSMNYVHPLLSIREFTENHKHHYPVTPYCKW